MLNDELIRYKGKIMGIDYGMGKTNINHETGIRFGVIPSHDVLQSWADSSESDFGEPSCGECGGDAHSMDDDDALWAAISSTENPGNEWRVEKYSDKAYFCPGCKRVFGSEDAYGDEPQAFILDDGEYEAIQRGGDCDIFITKSPYYTLAPFCSPCAPGACYLRDGALDEQARAYCFAPDWFPPCYDDEVTGKYEGAKTSCPYPVWRVSDNILVFRPEKTKDK